MLVHVAQHTLPLAADWWHCVGALRCMDRAPTAKEMSGLVHTTSQFMLPTSDMYSCLPLSFSSASLLLGYCSEVSAWAHKDAPLVSNIHVMLDQELPHHVVLLAHSLGAKHAHVREVRWFTMPHWNSKSWACCCEPVGASHPQRHSACACRLPQCGWASGSRSRAPPAGCYCHQ
jgi:hypothetical protein